MVKFLIYRPIAVFLSFFGLLFFSILALRELPVSLLPAIEVPAIVIKVNYPNTPPAIIESSILKPVRSELNSLDQLKSMESTASSETGMVRLRFNYGARMDLAYIEVNEKIDRLQETLPRDLERPQVVRVNTSDIPIIRIQVTPKNPDDFIEISELTEKVLKKRIEQVSGVSMVDINGRRNRFIAIEPDLEQLAALGISESQISDVLKGANRELGQLSIKDGQYRYFVRVANRLDDLEEIQKLPLISAEGQVVPLERVASASFQTEKVLGYHLFQNKEGLVITVHKQGNARMNEVISEIYQAVAIFKEDYPDAEFAVTQDQSQLLNAGIENLQSSLLFGGLFAFAVLFLFMGNARMPLVMGITLPVSLVISFLLFYVFQLSINIISLSGLALGLGMLIDNSIIVIDNITRKRKEGKKLIEACIAGVNEVIAPLISSVLTTLAVFVPLVFLNGLSGALFYDQALSVAIILGVSLLVAFILLPLLYRLFFQKQKTATKEDSIIFKAILKLYKSLFEKVFRYKTISILVLALLTPTAFIWVNVLEKTGLPVIEKTETLVSINWNEPVDALSNKERLIHLIKELGEVPVTEADIGIKQFLLSAENSTVEKAEVYINFDDQGRKIRGEQWITDYFLQKYPDASVIVKDAPNAFDQMFASNDRFFIAKWKNPVENEMMNESKHANLKQTIVQSNHPHSVDGLGFLYEESVEAAIDARTLSFYGIRETDVKASLAKALDGFLVTEIRRFGEVVPIRIKRDRENFQKKLQKITIPGKDGQAYPLSTFVNFTFVKDHKHITADRVGIYQSLEWDELTAVEVGQLASELPKIAAKQGLTVTFEGAFFENKENLHQLIFILAISITLLYFILAAQFESLVQPLIVIFTLPLGITGALAVIQLAGATLNVMSAIGIIVMLGIMVNDAILKIDTINRLKREKLMALGQIDKGSYRHMLATCIAKTGEIRLKPILMTSITTILALLPVTFSSGLGADLQRPLVYAVIGGLTIGTFTALYFVPLAYWFTSRKTPKLL